MWWFLFVTNEIFHYIYHTFRYILSDILLHHNVLKTGYLTFLADFLSTFFCHFKIGSLGFGFFELIEIFYPGIIYFSKLFLFFSLTVCFMTLVITFNSFRIDHFFQKLDWTFGFSVTFWLMFSWIFVVNLHPNLRMLEFSLWKKVFLWLNLISSKNFFIFAWWNIFLVIFFIVLHFFGWFIQHLRKVSSWHLFNGLKFSTLEKNFFGWFFVCVTL